MWIPPNTGDCSTKHHGDMHTSLTLFLLGASLVIVASNLVEAGAKRYVMHDKLKVIFPANQTIVMLGLMVM